MIDVGLRIHETSGRLIRATGTIGATARAALQAIEHCKHLVSVNAELDSLLGPVIKSK
jgi:predicted homoserine dehydrogenase-like protein